MYTFLWSPIFCLPTRVYICIFLVPFPRVVGSRGGSSVLYFHLRRKTEKEKERKKGLCWVLFVHVRSYGTCTDMIWGHGMVTFACLKFIIFSSAVPDTRGSTEYRNVPMGAVLYCMGWYSTVLM